MHSRWIRRLAAWGCGLVIASLSGCVTDGSGAKPESRAEAWRFLTQATFGPDEVNVDRLMTIGYEAWIDEQFSLHPSFTYRDFLPGEMPRSRPIILATRRPRLARRKRWKRSTHVR